MRFVPVEELKPGMKLGRRIINRVSTSMLEKGVELSDVNIERLKSNGYLGAYIADAFSDDIEIQETVQEKNVMDGIDAVANADVGSIIDVASELVSDISALDRISVDLLDLRSFDDYTYHHSVNVAVYAAAVATRMGLFEEQIQEITVAALCHDLGKARIPTEIINKKDRLTDEEFAEIKNHPRYGFDMLYDNPRISSVVRQAVICHHENENGSGYPLGKTGDEIPLYAKIIHAVDVYDALTSRRPYKEPYAPVDALEYLTGGIDILFDRNVVDIMLKVIPAYPPGMDIGLSNGEKAVVIAHTSDGRRPKIKIYDTAKEVDLSSDPDYRQVFITASGILMQDNSEGVETLNEDRMKPKQKEINIVVVDDSAIALKQAQSILGDEYKVTLLESGMACLNYIKVKGEPDLLIMDIDMPVMNGVVTVEKLRESGYRHLNVIFLTAIANREVVLRCNKAGASDYILKPVNPIYLKERVKIALDNNLDRV
ncbi:MAG: response regulator [Lachnospiraceae bacterium]|nr:response regulator [Lachnospiraceae bacterium]